MFYRRRKVGVFPITQRRKGMSNRNSPTEKQLLVLNDLIPKIEPTMVLPTNLNKNMASVRIKHLLDKMKNPKIKSKYVR